VKVATLPNDLGGVASLFTRLYQKLDKALKQEQRGLSK
jgi:hypothetical protein